MLSDDADEWYYPLTRHGSRSAFGAYACPSCGRLYKHRGNLRRHQVYECGKQAMFQCPHCKRRFHQQSNLKRHFITQHKKPQKQMKQSPKKYEQNQIANGNVYSDKNLYLYQCTYVCMSLIIVKKFLLMYFNQCTMQYRIYVKLLQLFYCIALCTLVISIRVCLARLYVQYTIFTCFRCASKLAR